MVRNKRIAFLLLNIVMNALVSSAFSQTNLTSSQVTISSPTAASLGKYGDIPININTGTPNINIPLYTVKSGTLELPINLSYHASGVKVQELASWVGTGWALNAGGVITRTVLGAPDDKGLNSYTDRGHFSDFGYNSYLFSAGPSSCNPTGGAGTVVCPAGTNYPPQDSYLQSGKYDGEPDLYFFNFNGHSGKFYFNDDRTPVIVPQQDLRITPIFPGTDTRGIIGFVITTPDGTKYTFGSNETNDGNIDAIEVTTNVTTQENTGLGATSAWYLNKIVSADDQFTISLIYQSENYSYYTLAMYPIPAVRNPSWWAYNLEYDLAKNYIKGVRLSKILFANGEVNFNSGNLRQDLSLGTPSRVIDDYANSDASGGRTLGSLSIAAADFCKKYVFGYGYFYDNSPLTGTLFTQAYPNLNLQSDKYRLRLESVQETSCDNSTLAPPYSFNYFSGVVPRRLSFAIDHWGYYNGSTNNGLIPTYTVNDGTTVTTTAGANRDAAFPEMRAGTLQKIIYPTNGSATFDFEPHTTFTTTSNYLYTTPVNLQVRNYSQSSFTSTITKVLSGTFQISSHNTTNDYPATATITDSYNNSNTITIGNTGPLPSTITLPQGTYTITLSLPVSATSGYADVSFSQWQTIITSNNQTVGGLRVTKITKNDGLTTNDIITNYGYNFDNSTSNGRSSGYLFSRPVYVQALRNDAWGIVGSKCSPSGCFSCFGTNASYYQSPTSIRPMSTTNGSHIGYSEVYISQPGNGMSLFKYYASNGSFYHSYDATPSDVCVRDLNLTCNPNILNSPAPPDPFDPMRGELAFEGHLDNVGQLLKTISYIPLYQFDSLTTPGIISKFFVTGYMAYGSTPQESSTQTSFIDMASNGIVPVGVTTFTEYNLKSAKKIRDSIIVTTYDRTIGTSTTDITAIYYKSKYHNGPTQKLSMLCSGETILTNYKNAFDFRVSSFDIADQLSSYYTNINSDVTYLNTSISALSTDVNDPYYYWKRLNIYTNFRYKKALHRQSYINFRRNNFTDPGSTYKTAHDAAKINSSTELKPILELQDGFRNPVIETSIFKNSNLISASFNRFDYDINGVFVAQSKLQTLFPSSLSTTFSNTSVVSSSNTSHNIIKDNRYTDEVLYKFKGVSPIEVTGKDGIMTSYIWGYNNSLPIVKATGIDVSTLNTAYAAASGNLSQMRAHSTLRNALINTYIYSPLVGITSVTDPSGKTITYEYDKLGRLTIVRNQNGDIMEKNAYKYVGQ